MTEMEQAPGEVQQQPPQEVEQITKEPEKNPKKIEKIKDPKKVKAGRALAEKNQKATEEKAAAEKKQEEESQNSANLISNIQLAGSVVGAGFVLWHGWNVVEPYMKKALSSPDEKKRERESTPSPPPPPPPPTPSPEEGILME